MIIKNNFLRKFAILPVILVSLYLSSCDDGQDIVAGKKKVTISGEYLSARFAQSNNNFDKSVGYFKKALSKSPKNTELLKKTYSAMLLAGKINEAITIAVRRKDIDDDDVLANVLVAIKLMKQQKFDDASILFEAISQKNTNRRNEVAGIVAPIFLAWNNAALGKYSEANVIMDEIVEIYALPFMEYHAAMIKDDAGLFKGAEELYDEVISRSLNYNQAYKISNFYKKIGNEKKASFTMDKFKEEYPDFVFGEYEKRKVNKEYSREEKSINGAANILREMAHLAFRSTNLNSAIIYLRLSLYLNPDSPYTNITLATALSKHSLYEESNIFYTKIPKNSSLYTEAQISIAENYEALGKDDIAFSMLEALSKEQNKTEPLFALADIYLINKKFSEASVVLSQALSQLTSYKKNNWVDFYKRGMAYERIGEWKKAESDFNKALELQPNQPDVVNYLAYSWLVKGINIQKAEWMLKTAILNRPNDAHILDSYGWALFKAGKYNESVKYLDKATMIMPYDPTVNDHLGDVFWRTGRYLEAKYQWERALIFEPELEEEEKIRAKLERGLPRVASLKEYIFAH